MPTIPHSKVVFGDLTERLKASDEEVKVPRQLLDRLLDLYISFWDFDEDWYLVSYPDVRTAVAQGEFSSGWAHFRATGYLEGRFGAPPVVDSDWYLSMYPDVAQAMLEGKIHSATEHFESHGYAEGRFPSDPGIDAKWYTKRYMGDEPVRSQEALENFLNDGYRNLALPAPPR